ncbi:Hypothetical predicted protein [Olea europaea subsp. europaea]|uniref:Uncharacterized protein n=1 Tax=Olea europaea subsp. europaea TaxID=158383 RepID=A0A8S0TW25_OLEEU|nr:Hypothetical predicted protein [Olea europaea subsp. europaea]
MPSGAKKRKAAKKKKENESSSNSNQPGSTVDSHGDDDMMHPDNKETDGGELSSPASQDHHTHQQHFAEEEEGLDKKEDSSNFVFIEGVKNEGVEEQKMVAEEGSVVQVEKELKNKGEYRKKDIVVGYDELPEKSYDGGVSGSSSNSSGSSSDDESRGLDMNKATVFDASVDLAEAVISLSERRAQAIHVALEEEAGDSVVQTCTVIGSEKVSLLNEEVEVNTSASLDISEASHISESELKENLENLKSAEENVVFSSASMDAAPDREAVEAAVQSAENAAETSDAKECTIQETDDKLNLSYSVPRVNDNNGAEHEKELSKPVVAPTLHPVQTTSWKSCCGLFDLLTGFGR